MCKPSSSQPHKFSRTHPFIPFSLHSFCAYVNIQSPGIHIHIQLMAVTFDFVKEFSQE